MPSVVQLALPNTTESHMDTQSHLDRGECHELNAETMKRCTGRRIAEHQYREGQGYLTFWHCNSCGKVIVI